MLKARIIPILTFNGFALVKTKQFANPRMVGNPVQAARVYNSRGVDELVFVDIFASKQNRKPNLNIVKDILKECMMPTAIGGAINTLDDINALLKVGADKVVIKSKALTDPDFISKAAYVFGSQCITIAVDAKKTDNGYKVHTHLDIDIAADEFVKQCEAAGAGEIILNSVDNDGMMQGFDTELVNHVSGISSLPLIACGGGGLMPHYQELFEKTKIEAVGSASIFHFTQYTPNDIKRSLAEKNVPVRLI